MANTHTHGYTHNRISINQLGIWMFFLGETFLFGALIAVRYYLQGVQRPDDLNQSLGLAITAVLLLSSLTAYRAETAVAHDDHPRFLRNLAGTVLLGSLSWSVLGLNGMRVSSTSHHRPASAPCFLP